MNLRQVVPTSDVVDWTHTVRCGCGAHVGEVDLIAVFDVGDDLRWEVRPRRRVRVGPDRRSMDAPLPEELDGTRRGGRRRRYRPRGVQWECWRGCRLPSMSVRDIAHVAEAEYQRGRDVIHVGV